MATKVQAEQFNMFQTVSDQVDANLDVFTVIPGFKERYNTFGVNLKQLFQLNKERNTDNSGPSKKLKQVRRKLIDIAYSVSSKLTAYALAVADQTLMSEVNFTKTDLVRSSYQNLVSRGEVILKSATVLIDSLTAYKVTQPMLDQFREVLDELRKSIPATRQSINQKEASGKSIVQLIKTNQALLKEMDTLAKVIRESDPAIYTAYKKARKIVSLPTRQLIAMGRITEAGGTAPVKGARILFYRIDKTPNNVLTDDGAAGSEKPILIKKSAKQGGFKVASLPEGMYRVEIVKTGYQTKVLIIAISHAETAKIEVELEKV
ncbi:MAG TPA: carboxypeptidase-like regulatory domain-containing protein [Bacteroidales bacterium]